MQGPVCVCAHSAWRAWRVRTSCSGNSAQLTNATATARVQAPRSASRPSRHSGAGERCCEVSLAGQQQQQQQQQEAAGSMYALALLECADSCLSARTAAAGTPAHHSVILSLCHFLSRNSPELFAYLRCAPNQKKAFAKGVEGLLGEGAVQVRTRALRVVLCWLLHAVAAPHACTRLPSAQLLRAGCCASVVRPCRPALPTHPASGYAENCCCHCCCCPPVCRPRHAPPHAPPATRCCTRKMSTSPTPSWLPWASCSLRSCSTA